MMVRSVMMLTLLLGTAGVVAAQDDSDSKPVELEVLNGSIGVWDGEIEVWPSGPDGDSIKFTAVETNKAYGEFWISSDLDSEFMGQTIKVHSIVGFDLDQKKLVGKVIDDGPYAASMTGEYDKETKTVHWVTEVKDPSGKPLVQRTSVTQTSADERVLVLSMPGANEGEVIKFMQIVFKKRD